MDILNTQIGGQLMAFSAMDGKTDWLNGLTGRIMGNCLELKLPYDGGALILPALPDGVYGDCLTAGNTRLAFADAYTIVIEGAVSPQELPDNYIFQQQGTRSVLAPRENFSSKWLQADFEAIFAARRNWLDSFNLADTPILRRAVSQLKTQINSPEGAIKHRWTTPDRWPHRNMWLWDSVFHCIGLRHFDLPLAKDTIRAVFDVQNATTGFIPHMGNPDGCSDISQPPILAYGMKKLWEMDQDTAFIAELYPKNKAFLQWCMDNRDKDGAGLLEWLIEAHENCRCGESGMDNSIRFDEALLLDAPDYNAFFAQECEIMAQFATRLKLTDDAKYWQNHLKRINSLMNQYLWDDNNALYCDYNPKTFRRSSVLSSAGFLPLLSGAPTQQMAQRMTDLLQNPQKFGPVLPIPSISCDVPGWCCDMWRGPMWVNINYLIAEGLTRYGYDSLANSIRDKTCAAIEKYFNQYGTFFEFYDAKDQRLPALLDRKGPNDIHSCYHQPLRDYGWTGTLYIDLCMKNNSAAHK